MNKKSFKMFFRSLLTKLGEVKTDKAVLTYDGDGELEVGMEVFVETEANDTIEYMHPEDGEYLAEDGRTIVIKDGFVEEIKEAMNEEPATEPTTEPANENMEEPMEPTEPAADPMEPTEPTFDAEAAYNELNVEFQAMKAELQELKDRVNALLEVPAEEDAFSKQTKVLNNEKTEHKGFMMKCNA